MVWLKKSARQRGDTLTEVMFATAVAALVIVLSVSAMNRSFAQTQMSVETTFVRQSMEEQAELLRFIRDSYEQAPTEPPGDLWLTEITAHTKAKASDFQTCYEKDPSLALNMPSDSFFVQKQVSNNTIGAISINRTDFARPETYAEAGKGIWVEAVQGSTSKQTSYIDFHIRACWEPPYSGPLATLGTIVRLYYEEK